MSGDALTALAEAAGLAVRWKDFQGGWHDVSPDTLRAVLAALGLPAGSPGEIADSHQTLRAPGRLPPLVTADAGGEVVLPVPPGAYRIDLEDGGVENGQAMGREGGSAFRAPSTAGYHTLSIGDAQTILATAPARCWTVADAAPGHRCWGIAVQLYALRRKGDGGIGDFGGLRDFVRPAAAAGAAAVAISPMHAQFSADSKRFSPYSPSSRVLMNVLHGTIDVPDAADLEAADFVDWPAASRRRLDALRAAFHAADAASLTEFAAFRQAQGASLAGHACFEALHAHVLAANPAQWHWRDWPEQFRQPSNPAVAAFAQDHAADVDFHAYLQFIAERSVAAAQAEARNAGMPIGLIADLAVGVDSGGSQCWSRQDETLLGLSVGAPPDLLSPAGQSWGLSAFSPPGLALNGFAAYLDMLRAAMRNAGGVRIDHAMGLARLWVLPDGASAAEGAYLHFPVDDMLRLIRLESQRHQAIVLGEDLGTLPEGFQEKIAHAGIAGMRVLWFERAKDNGFTAPGTWDHGAVAMSSTHDLATVAGWWRGRDLEWREKLELLPDPAKDAGERARDRGLLWSAMRASGAATGSQPAAEQPAQAVDAVVRHLATASCGMVLLPIEDFLGLEEQPNLPGTLDEHPNWRRRLPGDAARLLDDPATSARLASLDGIRNPR